MRGRGRRPESGPGSSKVASKVAAIEARRAKSLRPGTRWVDVVDQPALVEGSSGWHPAEACRFYRSQCEVRRDRRPPENLAVGAALSPSTIVSGEWT